MKTKEIKITNGAFCSGNCSDCLYANFRDTDSYGRVRCNGGYGGYNILRTETVAFIGQENNNGIL